MFILPALAGILGGIVEVLLKITVSKKYSSATYVFLINSLVTLIMLPFLINGFKTPSDFLSWFILIVNILMYIGSNLCFISALKYEDISNISLINRVSLILTFVFGILLFKENISFTKILGLILISLAVFIVFFDKEKFKKLKLKGLFYALTAGVFVSLANIAAKYNSNFFSSNIYIFFMYFGLAFFAFFLPKVKGEFTEVFNQVKYKIILIVIMAVTSYKLLIESYHLYSVSLSFVIISIFTITVGVLYGILVLGEKRRLLNKLIGLVIVICGLLFLQK